MSTILFDTVAVHAAWSQEFLVMEDLPLRVTDDGYTVVDSRNGRNVHCATKWRNIQAFKDRLTDTLLGSGINSAVQPVVRLSRNDGIG